MLKVYLRKFKVELIRIFYTRALPNYTGNFLKSMYVFATRQTDLFTYAYKYWSVKDEITYN